MNVPTRTIAALVAAGWALAWCAGAYGGASASRGPAAAVVVYAEGDQLSILDAHGRAVATDPSDAVGLELVAGDTIATESRTTVELQLVPSANVIKVAENTTFTIDERGSAQGGVFTLVYGKVRARVEHLTERDKFTIRGQSAIAGVRGTDFGVTVEVARNEEVSPTPATATGAAAAPAAAEELGVAAVTEVYCFQGQVEVTPTEPVVLEAPGGLPAEGQEQAPVVPVLVRANEMVSVSREAEPAEMKVEPLPEEVRTYWKENDFKAEPVAVSVADIGEQAGAVSEEPASAAAPAKDAAVAPAASTAQVTEQAKEPAAEPATKAATTAAAPVMTKEQVQAEIKRSTTRRFAFSAGTLGLGASGAVAVLVGVLAEALPSFAALKGGGAAFMVGGSVALVAGFFCAVESLRINAQIRALERAPTSP